MFSRFVNCGTTGTLFSFPVYAFQPLSAKLSATGSAGVGESSERLGLITQRFHHKLSDIRGLNRQILPQEPFDAAALRSALLMAFGLRKKRRKQ
jgi:hypothetical protein